MNEPVPDCTEDPFPVRGSFQPIDLGPNSDNEDAESWLVAPTPRAGSFCSQYWAPGAKSVYDDDLSPTMSCRSSLAGDAFPPLAQSPDPNFGGIPNSARNTARQHGLRSSTSRIPRPTDGPTPTRANDPMRQSMPTFPTTRKPGVPYRPSGRGGGGPPSASSAAHRNLAARQAELRASIARQNEIRASLGRGTPVSSPSPASSASPGGAAGPRGTRTPGAAAQGTMRAPQPKAPAQGERVPGSRIGSGATPASGGSYAAKLANTPNTRIPSGAPRTPATAPAASHTSPEPSREQEQATPASPTPQTPPSASLPTPNKLSPQLSAVGDAKTHNHAHPGADDDDLKSAHSGGIAEEHQQEEEQQQKQQQEQQQQQQKEQQQKDQQQKEQQQKEQQQREQQQKEQQKEQEQEQQQQQQQQQQEGQQQEVPQGTRDSGDGGEQEQQHQQQQFDAQSSQVQEAEGAAAGTKQAPTSPSREGSAHKGSLGGYSALSGQRLEVVDEQQVQPVIGVGTNTSLTSTPKAGQPATIRSNSKTRTELSSPPSTSTRLHGVSGTSLSHEMVTTPPLDSASEATQDDNMAHASTLVHVGETAKSLSIRGQTSLTSPSLSPEDWDASTTRSVAPMSESQPQPQVKSSQAAPPESAPAPKKKKPAQPQCCTVM